MTKEDMHTTAAKVSVFPAAPPTLEAGRVEGLGAAGVLHVRTASGPVTARRAKSCLVEPELGDRVLCAVEAHGATVVAILDGADSASNAASGAGVPTTRIAVRGDLEIAAEGGSARLTGTEGVTVASGGELGLVGASLHARAESATVAVGELGFFGKLVRAEVAKVTVLAEELDSIATRIAVRAKRVFRFVEELDQTRAGTVDTRADKLMSLRAENALVSARVLAKVDAEQIHLG